METEGFTLKHIAQYVLLFVPITALAYLAASCTRLSSDMQTDLIGGVDAFLFVIYVRLVIQHRRPLLKQILLGLQAAAIIYVGCSLINLL